MKKSHKVIIGLVFLAVLLVASITYNYVFLGEHRDIASEQADLTISATDLNAQFLADESLATTTYLDKVIEIEGVITAIESTEIVLNDQVQIRFTSEISTSQKNGAFLKIKGRCVGYDELLEMVKIDQAVLINKEN